MITRFRNCWTSAVDESYTTTELYFDIGKETCPQQASQVVPWSQLAAGVMDSPTEKRAETLLYRRCCLESYASQVENRSTDDRGTQKQVFYPFNMLRDTGSLTIETGKRSPRRAAGLLYSRFYTSVKEVFAAGDVYPFTNAAIETLDLDKKLRKTWELVGGGLSHQPAALIKAYLYTKLRCHYALLGSMQKSFGIREEHRVSKELFYAIDNQMRSRELHNKRLIIPTDDGSPYYSFTTDTLLRWVRWNINKFCVGFEMVYSFQAPHFVTWEHTRIMLMFLRCLQFSYTGGLIQKQPDAGQPNGLRRHEGLGFKLTMERYGYAWFLDKIDWNTLTFRQPYAPYMMFDNPSMQNVYRARYHQVRDVRIVFIRMNKAYQWMLEFNSIPMRLDLLENYLRELCLCAFRKDVFFHVKSALKPEYLESALPGEIPLCYDSVNNAMLKDHQPLQLAQGNRLAVKDIHVLFAWLWKSKDDYFERQRWNEKPYRTLFQQSFHAIKTARGKAGARIWRQDLKRSFLGSHWILPYTHSRGFMRKDKEEKQFIWWPSAHQGLIRHYAKSRQTGTLAYPLLASNIKLHPIDGWQLATTLFSKSYMPYVMQPEQELIRVPENEFYAQLVGRTKLNYVNPVGYNLRREIAKQVQDIPGIIQNQRGLSTWPTPPPTTDKLGCNEEGRIYVTGTIRGIQGHYREEHEWSNPRGRGRRLRNQPIDPREVLWRAGVQAQRLFRNGPASSWLEVGFGAPVSQTADEAARRERAMRAMEQKQRQFELEDKECIKAAEAKTDANAWLEHVGWASHLDGLHPEAFGALHVPGLGSGWQSGSSAK
ncbi:hypothetical protein DER44DRAFT_858398 [Fusarium oxysporum]|nr:hypothetical protein DER44DRAFT_858398 [Fusarium oxysporum]